MNQVQPVAEIQVLELLMAGDDKTLKVVYRQNYQTVVSFILNNGGTLQEAKDTYQETIIVFCEKLKQDGFELNCSIKTFLYSIGRRLWLKQLKRKSRFTTEQLNDSEEYLPIEEDKTDEREEQFYAMNQALEQLGEPCRSILKDFYINGNSMEEITQKFGYTNADNAKNQKYKCLKRLKKSFFEVFNNGLVTNEEFQRD
jgi:RNA polymerase sigma factor (sigma-70 family)